MARADRTQPQVAMAEREMAAASDNAAVRPGMTGGSPQSALTTRNIGGTGARAGASDKGLASGGTTNGGGDEASSPDRRIREVANLGVFTLEELWEVTRNFKADTLLGEGGFGRVYKGWVDERTLSPARNVAGSMPVAVKKLNRESTQGVQEWQKQQEGRWAAPPRRKGLGRP
ncbi:unnamed protein product [Urochloa humidicola]